MQTILCSDAGAGAGAGAVLPIQDGYMPDKADCEGSLIMQRT